MYLFFDRPILLFAVRTAIAVVRNDLVIHVTEYSLTFCTLFGIIERNTITNWTCYQLYFEKRTIHYPFLINCYQFWLLI